MVERLRVSDSNVRYKATPFSGLFTPEQARFLEGEFRRIELAIVGADRDAYTNKVNLIVQNGYQDRSASSLSFVDGTRTLTLSPVDPTTGYEVWSGDKKRVITTDKTATIPDTEALYYIYMDVEGNLQYTTTFDINLLYRDSAYTAAIYWDAVNNTGIIVNDERHRRMDFYAHGYLHQTLGAQWIYGLALGDMNVDGLGSSNASAQFSVSSGAIRDEDIYNEIADGSPQELSTIAQIPLLYRSGTSGLWRKIAATDYPVTTTGTGRAAYNQFTGATWQLTEVSNAQFVLMHYFATNDINEPIIGVIGQGTYATKMAAEDAANTEINSLIIGILDTIAPELCPLATVIWQTSDGYSNAVKSRIVSTGEGADYVDWRFSGSTRTGVGVDSIVHNDTLARDAADAHPYTSITGLGTAAVADILGTVSQSGGVPTGDIIEQGSNANGEYTMFADGTMICMFTRSVGGAWANGAKLIRSWSFPATFSGGAYYADVNHFSSAEHVGTASSGPFTSSGNSLSSTVFSFVTVNSSGASHANATETFFAIGRWF